MNDRSCYIRICVFVFLGFFSHEVPFDIVDPLVRRFLLFSASPRSTALRSRIVHNRFLNSASGPKRPINISFAFREEGGLTESDEGSPSHGRARGHRLALATPIFLAANEPARGYRDFVAPALLPRLSLNLSTLYHVY